MLRIAGEPMAMGPCPTCKGTGRVKCPAVLCVRSGVNGDNGRGGSVMAPGVGSPIPCPECKGKKIIPVADLSGGAGGGSPGISDVTKQSRRAAPAATRRLRR